MMSHRLIANCFSNNFYQKLAKSFVVVVSESFVIFETQFGV